MSTLIQKVTILLFIPLFWVSFIIISFLTLLFQLLQVNKIRAYFRKGQTMAVLYLEVFPSINAGYKYRSGCWVSILNEKGFKAKVASIFKLDRHIKFINQPHFLSLYFLAFCWKRFFQCLSAFNYDLVVVRRELLIFNDYGNLFMEKFLRSINNKLVLDFDDDISASKHEPRQLSFYGKLMLETPDKFYQSIKQYHYFMTGTKYLKDKYVPASNSIDPSRVFILPTLVNYNRYPPKKYDLNKKKLTFGWIGSPNNYLYLPMVLEPLNKLSEKYDFEFIIIAGKPFEYRTRFDLKQYQWSLKNELSLLHQIDVGVMPLHDNLISRGKSGFKLIQYMGCGIVSIASGITVINEIIDDKVDGFIVRDESEWYNVLEEVINSKSKFTQLGYKAFEKIKNNYSFDAYTEKYINFMKFVKVNT